MLTGYTGSYHKVTDTTAHTHVPDSRYLSTNDTYQPMKLQNQTVQSSSPVQQYIPTKVLRLSVCMTAGKAGA